MGNFKFVRFVILLVSAAGLLLLVACPIPHEPKIIDEKSAAELIANFERSNLPRFANSYLVSLSAIRSLAPEGALRVFHAVTERGEKRIILAPAKDDGTIVQQGPFMMLDEQSLCPPICDRQAVAAVDIPRDLARRYTEQYAEANDGAVTSFFIAASVVQHYLSTQYQGIEIHHGFDGRDRSLVIKGWGTDRTNSVIYLQDKNHLCPPICDIISATSNR